MPGFCCKSGTKKRKSKNTCLQKEADDGISEEDQKVLHQILEGLSKELPEYAWRVPFSYECKENCQPFTIPRFNQLAKLAPTAWRVLTFWLRKRLVERKKPFIDVAAPLQHRPIFGVPLGGIGSGTIGRGYRGEFCRFQLVPADYIHSVVDTNQFIVTVSRRGQVVYNRVLSVLDRPPKKYAGLKKWNFAFPEHEAAYLALYPRSWTVYRIPELKLRLICRQVSPVIPHNYTDSSLPVAVFVWTVESLDNAAGEPLEVSITFTFKNGVGRSKLDRNGTVRNYSFSHRLDESSSRIGLPQPDSSDVLSDRLNADSKKRRENDGAERRVEGALIEQTMDGQKCTYVLGACAVDEPLNKGVAPSGESINFVDVSACVAFDPHSKEQRCATRCNCVSHERDKYGKQSRRQQSQASANASKAGEKVNALPSADSSNSQLSKQSQASDGCNSGLSSEDSNTPFVKYRAADDRAVPFVSYSQQDSASRDSRPELNCSELNSGTQFWEFLNTYGRLLAVGRSEENGGKETQLGIANEFVETQKRDVCAAVCATCSVRPGERASLEFVLGWHMPEVHFKGRELRYKRRYTRWFPTDFSDAVKLAAYAVKHYREWEAEIEQWQAPVLGDARLPDWYKYALFNETYFVSDGGTIWFEQHENDSDPGASFSLLSKQTSHSEESHSHVNGVLRDLGHFAYLEGHEYRMFNTYDVHFFASFALITLWPDLQKVIQYNIARYALSGDHEQVSYVFTGQRRPRLEQFTVPHDVGNPEDEPFVRVNGYEMAPSADWKDLASKFVLQVYRDASLTGDLVYLRTLYPVARTVFDRNLRLDSDGDGLPDHIDVPDSTFDAWLVRGACVYTSVLWLCASFALWRMAERLIGKSTDEEEKRRLRADSERYEKQLEAIKRGVEAQFWNEFGGYYQFGSSFVTSARRRREVIMAASLMGYWYLQSCAAFDEPSLIDRVLPRDHVERCLQSIHRANVSSIEDGRLGAINGAHVDGSPDISSMQSEEVWTGVVYAVSSSMMYAGLVDQGLQTARGCFTACLRRGLHFQTPEALLISNRYRSLGYMRPLSIWSMQLAYDHMKTSAEAAEKSSCNSADC